MLYRTASAIADLIDVDTGQVHRVVLSLGEARLADRSILPQRAIVHDQEGYAWTVWKINPGDPGLRGQRAPFHPAACDAGDYFEVYGTVGPDGVYR